MSTSWLDLFVDPQVEIVDKDPRGESSKRAASMLLRVQLDEYDRLAADLGLPRHRHPGKYGPAAENQFLAAVLRAVTGDAADARVPSIPVDVPDAGSDLRVVMAALAGLIASGEGRPDLAIGQMTSVAEAIEEPVAKAFASLHVAVRLAEQGQFQPAAATTASALNLLKSVPESSATAAALAAVAEHNLADFRWRASQAFPRDLPRLSQFPALARLDQLVSFSLGTYLDEHFKSFFGEPYTRTITLAAGDKVSDGLAEGLFRAECLAFAPVVSRLRRTLGRYTLLQQVGSPGPGRPDGFVLLRRAGDYEGIKLAARVFRAAGPLEDLERAGAIASRITWLVPEFRADMVLISETAVTFPTDLALTTFDRILAALTSIDEWAGGDVWMHESGLDALANLLPLVDARRQNKASRYIRSLAERPGERPLHQSLGPVLHGLSWRSLSGRERNAWGRFVASYLSTTDDRLFPALEAAAALLPLGSSGVARSVLSAHRQTRSLWVAHLVLALPDLAVRDRTALTQDIVQAAKGLRDKAHQGQFGLGGITVGRLLGRVALRFHDRTSFSAFVEFIQDPMVPPDERVEAAQEAIRHPDAVPTWGRQRLGRRLAESQVRIPLFGGSASLDAVDLQLGVLFGDLSSHDALAGLLRLAHAGEVDGRIQAVQCLSVLAKAVDQAAIAAILLGLTYDAVPEVRGFAGNALAGFELDQPSLAKARISRLGDLVRAPGEVVPRFTWIGLANAVQRGQVLPPELVETARTVAERHIAYTVRKAAAGVIENKSQP